MKIDHTGKRYGRLTGIEFVSKDKHGNSVWRFVCDCGAPKVIVAWLAKSGHTKSCGCAKRTHGAHSNVASKSPTYSSWESMKARCRHHPKYQALLIAPRWLSYPNFLADMGERPAGMSLDRIDNSKGYEPGNCRWATPAQQVQNRSNTKLEPHEPAQIRWLVSEGYSRRDVARFFGVNSAQVSRIASGKAWAEGVRS